MYFGDNISMARIVCVVLMAATLAIPDWVDAQPEPSADAPRTAWGTPSFEGTWQLATMTPLERPEGYEDRPTISGEEAEAFLERLQIAFRQGLDAALSADVEFGDGGATESIVDDPLLDERTSLVISPSTGRIPFTPIGRERRSLPSRRMREVPDGPEDRAMDERCMMGGSLPLRRSPFPAVFFQTPGHLVIHHEFVNGTIIIPIDDRPPIPSTIQQWTGASRGSWDGDTLVVESSNFDPRATFQGSGAALRLVQRLTRIDHDTLHYAFTVYDEVSFTAPWSVEFPLTNTEEPTYEFACHEGNRSMPLLLSGARATEEKAEFVGAFNLESFERMDDGDGSAPTFTDGMLSYDASGRVSVHLTDGDTYFAYYGNYNINVTQGVVRHDVEDDSRRVLHGTALRYLYELSADRDTLVLSWMDGSRIASRASWRRHR